MRLINTIGVLVGTGLCVGPFAASAAASVPVISGLQATPASVESGGTTIVSASVSGARTCKLSANKPVSGLPAKFACEGEADALTRELTMPVVSKFTDYKLTLTATGIEGTVKAETSVSVRPTATQVVSGYEHSCALVSTGHVECWGEGKYGQLGEGLKVLGKDVPVEVKSIGTASQVAAGGFESCALLSSGHLDCWGANKTGQLGDGTTENAATPVEVQDLVNVSQVTVGGNLIQEGHACGLLSTGHVYCWGVGRFGQLGDGSTSNSDTPVEVQDISDATQVTAGDDQTCALLSTGHIDCWGEDLSDGTTEGSDTPVEVSDIADATQVSAGAFHTCAVLSTGHMDCWGSNKNGELGNGTTESADMPVEVQGVTAATQTSAGVFDSCAVLSSGRIDCWGAGGLGRLGDGSENSTDTPVEVKDIGNGSQVAAGFFHTCALVSTGQVDCWGDDSNGELGDGQKGGGIFTDTPVEVFGL